MTIQEEVKAIRKGFKSLCKTLSVTRGKGTSYGWVEIHGSGEFGNFSDEEKAALETAGKNRGGNFAVIAPEERSFWVERFSA